MAGFASVRGEEIAVANADAGFHARLTIPIEQILHEVTERTDMSFIFDSRLLRDRRILPIDRGLPTTEALADSLKTANLELHQISSNTFAITAQTSVISVPALDIAPLVTSIAAPILMDTIVVTGVAASSAFKSGPNGIFVVDGDFLEAANATSTSEIIFDLPQSLASVSAANTALLGASAGLNLADLRGFGVERTIVLVNGRRRTLTSGGNGTIAGVDLNSIGEPFLERIEVLDRSDGARLGSDAVAGGINFVTRKNIDSVEVGGSFGTSDQQDATEQSLYAIAGTAIFNDRFQFTIGGNYVNQNGLLGRDREVTSQPFGFAINGRAGFGEGAEFLPGFGGSTITPEGALSGVIDENGNFVPTILSDTQTVLTGDGGVEPFEGRLDQLFNWSNDTNTILPNERVLGLINFSYEVSPRVKFFGEANLGWSNTNVQLSSVPASSFQGTNSQTGDGVAIALDNPTITPAVREFVLDEFGSTSRSVVVNRRYVELGPRIRQLDRRYNDAVLGFDFDLDEETRLESFIRLGRNTTRTYQLNRIDRDRLSIALDPALCGRTAGCVAADLFVLGGVSNEAADFIRAAPLSRKLLIDEREVQSALSKKILGMETTFGAAIRNTHLEDRDLSPEDLSVIGALTDNEFEVRLTVGEVFFFVDTPVPKRFLPFGEVDLSFAYRLTASGHFGSVHNLQGALNWQVKPGLFLSVDGHVGDRAPNITELFFIGRGSDQFFIDPCSDIENESNETIVTNCTGRGPLGIREGFSQTNFLAETVSFGNPELHPETITRFGIGLNVEPTKFTNFLPGDMNVRASWNEYSIDNMTTFFEDTLTSCFESVGLSDSACGSNPITGQSLIQRDPVSRQIEFIGSVLSNRGQFEWRGLDIEMRYNLEPEYWGVIDNIWISGLHTYTNKVTLGVDEGVPTDLLGLADYPRHRSLIAAGLSAGSIDFSVLARRRGQVVTTRRDVAEARIPAFTTIDATARLNIRDRASISVGFKNIANREPPVAAFLFGNGSLPEYYDIIGRRFTVNLKAAF